MECFSNMHGVVSGIAALLMAIVGLLAVSVQLGWIGGDDDDGTSSGTTVTSADGATGGGSGGGSITTTTAAANLTVSPASIRFVALQAKKQTVTVRNDGAGSVTLRPPEISGTDRNQFSAAYVNCPTPLPAGRSCPVEVTFTPTRAGQYSAALAITPTSGKAVEVTIEGNHLL